MATDQQQAPVTPQTPPAVASDPVKGDGPKGGEDALRADLADERRKRHAAEARVAELEPLAAKATQLEDQAKTETERLQEKAQQAEERAQVAEAEKLRLNVAYDKGLSPAQARRLQGKTKEELEADADELVASFGKSSNPADQRAPGKPAERLEPGAVSTDKQEKTDPDDWIRGQVAAKQGAP